MIGTNWPAQKALPHCCAACGGNITNYAEAFYAGKLSALLSDNVDPASGICAYCFASAAKAQCVAEEMIDAEAGTRRSQPAKMANQQCIVAVTEMYDLINKVKALRDLFGPHQLRDLQRVIKMAQERNEENGT